MPKTTKKTVKTIVEKTVKNPTAATQRKVLQTKLSPQINEVAVLPKTEAQKIWEEIKDLPIQMFGLPDQTIVMHANPVTVEPSKLYLVIRSSAALPSLEESIKGKFSVELADKFVIVTRTPSLFGSKRK